MKGGRHPPLHDGGHDLFVEVPDYACARILLRGVLRRGPIWEEPDVSSRALRLDERRETEVQQRLMQWEKSVRIRRLETPSRKWRNVDVWNLRPTERPIDGELCNL